MLLTPPGHWAAVEPRELLCGANPTSRGGLNPGNSGGRPWPSDPTPSRPADLTQSLKAAQWASEPHPTPMPERGIWASASQVGSAPPPGPPGMWPTGSWVLRVWGMAQGPHPFPFKAEALWEVCPPPRGSWAASRAFNLNISAQGGPAQAPEGTVPLQTARI